MPTTPFADEPAVATDAPSRWRELIASRLGLDFGLDFGLGTAVEDRTATEDPSKEDAIGETGTTERDGPSDGNPPTLDRWWVLVAPLAGAVVLSAASWLFDPNPLSTGTSASGLLAFAVLIPFFLVCAAGTLAVIRDATRLRAAGTDWSPNPWHYVVPSAVVLAVMHATRLLGGIEQVGEVGHGGTVGELVGVLAGSLVVALVASSILAGPAYLFQRRRQLSGEKSGRS